MPTKKKPVTDAPADAAPPSALPANLAEALAGVKSADDEVRTRALAPLRSQLLADRKWVPNAVSGVAGLLAVAADPSVPGRERVLALVGNILTGGHKFVVPTGFDLRDPSLKRSVARAPARDVVAVVGQATATLSSLLVDPNGAIRTAAAFVLAFEFHHAAEANAALRSRLDVEMDPFALASAVLAFGLTARYRDDKGAVAAIDAVFARSQDALVRGAAVLARRYLDETAPSGDERAALLAMVRLGNRGERFPWFDGRVDMLVARVLEARAATGAVVGARLLAEAARDADPGAPLVNEWAAGALQLALPLAGPKLASDLTPEQREIVVALSSPAARFDAGFGSFGVPRYARERRRWLGLDNPGVMEKVVTLTVGGQPQSAPLWKSISDIQRGSPPSDALAVDDALYAQLRSVLALEAYVEVCAEIFMRNYELRISGKPPLVDVIRQAGDRALPWAEALIAELLAEGPDRPFGTRVASISMFALWPLVRGLSVGETLPEKYEALVVPMRPEEVARAVFGAVAPPRREARVFPPIEALVQRSPEIALSCVIPLLDLVPTRGVADRVLSVASKLLANPYPVALDTETAKRAIARVEEVAVAEDEVRAALETWRAASAPTT